MGGAKGARTLAGRPLVAYPAAALAAVCDRVAVVAKRDSQLPPIGGLERWHEPDEPRHPLTGIVQALETAGAPIVVCAVDMPFVTASALCTLLVAAGGQATVARAGGRLQPLLAVYGQGALPVLRAAADAPLTDTVAALQPVLVELDGAVTRSVDTPAALAAAERELA
jgi:molybdopterin-guanine dinucleotide biosynthesis protein A